MTTVYDDLGDQVASDVPMRRIRFTINGARKAAEVEPRLLLSHLIRQGLGLTGTHMGCDTTNCGACTVLVDGKAIKSCTMLAVQADGHEITTVEGLATASELHPLQEGFKQEHGLQCGFCTPGMMLAAKALRRQSRPDRGRRALGAVRQPLPLHRLPEHREVGAVGRGQAPVRAGWRRTRARAGRRASTGGMT
jgi:carbon-monoxide dehydrogenase small subunit